MAENYTNVYSEFKQNLLQQLEMKRDFIVAHDTLNRPDPLFEIASSDDKLYMKVLREFELIAIQNAEQLILELCYRKNIMCRGQKDADLIVNISGQPKSIEFKTSPHAFNSASLHRYVYQQQHQSIPTCFVFLLWDGIKARESLNRFCGSIAKIDSSVDIDAMIFEEFLEMLFGTEEKEAFLHSMRTFKEEMHQAVGYQITEICSSQNKEKLKHQLLCDLRDCNYYEIKTFHEYSSQKNHATPILADATFAQIVNQYLTNQAYSILVGTKDFAKSFVTSEWLYRKYSSLEGLDNTFIVAGYLKSIEQLLWSIAQIIGQGRHIGSFEISEENYDSIDKTLGSLERFFKDGGNADLFRDNLENQKQHVIYYLQSRIASWRKAHRNVLLHKGQLNDVYKIDIIRKETIYLYMLILGSINLTPGNLADLM